MIAPTDLAVFAKHVQTALFRYLREAVAISRSTTNTYAPQGLMYAAKGYPHAALHLGAPLPAATASRMQRKSPVCSCFDLWMALLCMWALLCRTKVGGAPTCCYGLADVADEPCLLLFRFVDGPSLRVPVRVTEWRIALPCAYLSASLSGGWLFLARVGWLFSVPVFILRVP